MFLSYKNRQILPEQRQVPVQAGAKPGPKKKKHVKTCSRPPRTLARTGGSLPSREGREGRARSSKEGRRADALALRADERRDKLRKASGRSTYPMIRRSLNGETRLCRPQSSTGESIACGGEPGELKHLSTRRKRKKHRFRQ